MTGECGLILKHWEETVECVAHSPADPLGSKGWVVIAVLLCFKGPDESCPIG